MTKWAALILVIALVFVLAGCGGSTEPAAPAKDGTPQATFTVVKILPTNTPVPPPPTPLPSLTPTPEPSPTLLEEAENEEGADVPTKAAVTEEPLDEDVVPETDDAAPDEERMALVPAGEFSMGSQEGDESPIHTIAVEEFEIDLFEVSNAEFGQFVDETGHVTDAETQGDPNSWRVYFTDGKENFPVVKVSWNDADAYCQWAGKRLPTEAEWEKAAKGSDQRVYPWGDEWDASQVNGKESGYRGPVTVGSFPGGASPFGLMDMAGNVWEWTADWYQGYPNTPFTSNYFGETYKVLRGGGWFSDQETVRTTVRNANSPDAANDDIGFRCAR